MYILSLECLYRQISHTLHLETESKAAHKMDIFCGKHGNTMSDLYSSYVTFTLVIVQWPLKPGEKSVKLNGKVQVCICALSSQFAKSNEAHTPQMYDTLIKQSHTSSFFMFYVAESG